MTNTAAPARRRIGLFTSGRQDWWILKPVADAVAAHPDLSLTVFISGTHLRDEFGRTERDVRAGGHCCVDVSAGRDDLPVVAPASLAAMAGCLAEAMQAHEPEVMVVLGDRIETLMAAVTAVADRRLLAHIHGGDLAPGEFDDAARHAITKLAHVHFPATEASGERIRRMGEANRRIHVVGSPSIDGVLADGLADGPTARAAVGLTADEPYVILLYHPAGLGDTGERLAVSALAEGVAAARLRAVCIGPNSDPGREAIRETLGRFSREQNWPILPTVDRRVFLRLIGEAVALVGNSSAGMVESAAVGAAVVNVGPRQAGREHSGNVLHVPARAAEVAAALRRLRDEPDFAGRLRAAPCVFGDGLAGRRIADVLATMDVTERQRIKRNEY